MEDFERLSGDFTLEQARDSLTEAATAIERAHEKLKILEAAMTRLSTVDQQDDPIPETSYGYIAVDLHDFSRRFTIWKPP